MSALDRFDGDGCAVVGADLELEGANADLSDLELAVGVADGLSHLSMLFVMRPVPSLKTIVTNLHSE